MTSNKVAGNISYSPDTETVLFTGMGLVDDNPKDFKGSVLSQYGVEAGSGYILYIDPTAMNPNEIPNRTHLPSIQVMWNAGELHNNLPFVPTNTNQTLKVVEIEKPNGIRLRHIALLLSSKS